MRLVLGIFLFLLGPNLLMLCTRLDPYPGLFLQCSGCVATATMSWIGGDIIRREKSRRNDHKSS